MKDFKNIFGEPICNGAPRWSLAGFIVLMALLSALTGCGSSGGSTNPYYDCTWTQGQFDQMYLEVQGCVGMTAPQPPVIFKPWTGPMGGYSGINGGEVWINTAPHWAGFHTCPTDETAIRHEYVHHLLWVNLGDASHDTTFFNRMPVGCT